MLEEAALPDLKAASHPVAARAALFPFQKKYVSAVKALSNLFLSPDGLIYGIKIWAGKFQRGRAAAGGGTVKGFEVHPLKQRRAPMGEGRNATF